LEGHLLFFSYSDAFEVPGVQLNVRTLFVDAPWSQCYDGTYAINLTSSLTRTILTTCNKRKLLLGCRDVITAGGPHPLVVAAMGYRADVLYDCSSTRDCTRLANGVRWYYSDSHSWGFARGTDTVDRSACDTTIPNSNHRLCWSTGSVSRGDRCGSLTNRSLGNRYQRVIYHVD
jgi:hypothetical protein